MIWYNRVLGKFESIKLICLINGSIPSQPTQPMSNPYNYNFFFPLTIKDKTLTGKQVKWVINLFELVFKL
jgi:hypothetical protein